MEKNINQAVVTRPSISVWTMTYADDVVYLYAPTFDPEIDDRPMAN